MFNAQAIAETTEFLDRELRSVVSPQGVWNTMSAKQRFQGINGAFAGKLFQRPHFNELGVIVNEWIVLSFEFKEVYSQLNPWSLWCLGLTQCLFMLLGSYGLHIQGNRSRGFQCPWSSLART